MASVPASPSVSQALLIVGHGTRNPRGLAEFAELLELVGRLQPQWRVAGCFLELARPSIFEALEQLLAEGHRQVIVLPLLLFAAGHAKQDIPRAVAAFAAAHAGLQVCLARHLGCEAPILAASARQYENTLAGHANVAAPETLLLLVGRGSHDAEARAEMERFAELRRQLTPVGHLHVAYLAMAEPRVEDSITRVAELKFPRVVVQPHLLFAGDLQSRLQLLVAECESKFPWQQWIMTSHLGVSRGLAECVLNLAHEASRRFKTG